MALRKTKQIALRPMSPERQALFEANQCPPDRAAKLHEELETRFDQVLAMFKIKPTKDHEGDGNKVLAQFFRDEKERNERYARNLAHDKARRDKRELRRANPDITFPFESWTDRYGEVVKVGDTIQFMTLYGHRLAKVLNIYEDIDYYDSIAHIRRLYPVVFLIEPFQPEGFEDVFKPVQFIESERTWNPCKWIGRERTTKTNDQMIDRLGEATRT